jgi:hypothetical protein
VLPGAQRKLVGATLLKAVFDRAAYGCRLFCCWCAQDLDANYFWESLGFIPLAFRAGASGKRKHIFWQRRIREGDTTTPYWFPAKTDGGMMREDRLVLPIPPGVHLEGPDAGAPARSTGYQPVFRGSEEDEGHALAADAAEDGAGETVVRVESDRPYGKARAGEAGEGQGRSGAGRQGARVARAVVEKVNSAGGASLLQAGERGKYDVARLPARATPLIAA